MNHSLRHLAFGVPLLLLAVQLHAQVPQLINYQGRVAVNGVYFEGTGQFKFALVDGSGSTTYWSNDGSSNAGSEPTNAVHLAVTKGLYSVLLGDATLANMTAIPLGTFNNADVRVRVWFNDGANGFQLLTPDQRIAAVGYAMVAGTAQTALVAEEVADGSVTAEKMADGSVTADKLAPGLATPWVRAGPDISFTSGETSVASLNLPATTDSEGVVRLGGDRLIHAFGTDNFFAGRLAGNFSLSGQNNTGVGHNVLSALSTGINNTGLGSGSLLSTTTGRNNTAIGQQALSLNSTGSNNSALGQGALERNLSGEFNTAVGAVALKMNETGSRNTAVGHGSLTQNTVGSNNTAIGLGSLLNNLTGSESTALGKDSLFANTTGLRNTAVGTSSLRDLTSGTDNVAIGQGAGIALQNGSANIYVGNGGRATETGTIRIGDGDQTRAFLAGVRGVTTSQANALPVVIDSLGQLGTAGGMVDTDPANEIQILSLAGNELSLSNGGGVVTLGDNSATNEIQALSLAGSDLTLSKGGGTFSINDADADPVNEIQSLSLAGNAIQLSKGGGNVNLEGGITTAMLADGSVAGEKIANGAVGTAQIASGAVTEAAIADGAVTIEKLAGGIPKVVQKSNRPFNRFTISYNFNGTLGASSGNFLPYGFSGASIGTSTYVLVLREKIPDDLLELTEIATQIALSHNNCRGALRLKRVNALGQWETVSENVKNTAGIHTLAIPGPEMDLGSFQYFIEIEMQAPPNTAVEAKWCNISYRGFGI